MGLLLLFHNELIQKFHFIFLTSLWRLSNFINLYANELIIIKMRRSGLLQPYTYLAMLPCRATSVRPSVRSLKTARPLESDSIIRLAPPGASVQASSFGGTLCDVLSSGSVAW